VNCFKANEPCGPRTYPTKHTSKKQRTRIKNGIDRLPQESLNCMESLVQYTATGSIDLAAFVGRRSHQDTTSQFPWYSKSIKAGADLLARATGPYHALPRDVARGNTDWTNSPLFQILTLIFDPFVLVFNPRLSAPSNLVPSKPLLFAIISLSQLQGRFRVDLEMSLSCRSRVGQSKVKHSISVKWGVCPGSFGSNEL
jgi:hypothetical protein